MATTPKLQVVGMNQNVVEEDGCTVIYSTDKQNRIRIDCDNIYIEKYITEDGSSWWRERLYLDCDNWLSLRTTEGQDGFMFEPDIGYYSFYNSLGNEIFYLDTGFVFAIKNEEGNDFLQLENNELWFYDENGHNSFQITNDKIALRHSYIEGSGNPGDYKAKIEMLESDKDTDIGRIHLVTRDSSTGDKVAELALGSRNYPRAAYLQAYDENGEAVKVCVQDGSDGKLFTIRFDAEDGDTGDEAYGSKSAAVRIKKNHTRINTKNFTISDNESGDNTLMITPDTFRYTSLNKSTSLEMGEYLSLRYDDSEFFFVDRGGYIGTESMDTGKVTFNAGPDCLRVGGESGDMLDITPNSFKYNGKEIDTDAKAMYRHEVYLEFTTPEGEVASTCIFVDSSQKTHYTDISQIPVGYYLVEECEYDGGWQQRFVKNGGVLFERYTSDSGYESYWTEAHLDPSETYYPIHNL